MKQISIVCLLVAMTVLPVQAAGSEERTLANGINVRLLDGGSEHIASIALVCPLPAVRGEKDQAAIALISELIWTNREGRSEESAYDELVKAARRFNGTLSSEVTPDALVIHISLPESTLPFMLKRLAALWGELDINEEMLAAARARVLTKQRSFLYASMQNQVVRQMMNHLWSDLSYRLDQHGSDQALASVTTSDVNQMLLRLKQPSRWTLYLRGPGLTEENAALLENTLSTIEPGAEAAEEHQPELAAMSRKKINVPADIDEQFCGLAYRLPAAGIRQYVLLDFIEELLLSSDGIREIAQKLAEEGGTPQITVNAEQRRFSGALFIFASWKNQSVSVNTAVEELYNYFESLAAEQSLEGSFEVARKRLTLKYWLRYSDMDEYTLWRARLASSGVEADTYIDTITELSYEDFKAFLSSQLNKSESVSLITVAP